MFFFEIAPRYLSFLNHNNYDEVLEILEKTLHDVLEATSIPACNEVQCGWATSHSLEGAQSLAEEFLEKRAVWHIVFSSNPY